MDVIGNNISNVNTTGFKSGRAVFQDLLSQTLVGGKTPTDARGGVNPRQVGMGGFLAAVDNIFESGTITTTAKTTDLAIQGDGFFVVRGEGSNEYYYTRAGDFNFDRYGTLVNASGYPVQGWMADPATGELIDSGEVGDIVVNAAFQTVQAKATTEVSMNAVLNTVANASVVEYPSLLHTADSSDNIYSVFSTNGVKLDLADNEPVRIKADVTEITDLQYAYNDSDVNLNLTKNPNLLVYVNNTAYTLTYGVDFKTMGELAVAIENKIEGAAGNGAVANNFVKTTVSGIFNEATVTPSVKAATTESWTVAIDPSNPARFTVTGSVSGTVNSGVVGQTYTAKDPVTGESLFTIPSSAWSGSWAAGETVTFDTTAAPASDFTVEIVNGKLKVTRDTDNGVDVQINSFSGSPYLAVIMQSISGTYNEASTSRSSDEIFFEDTKYAGRDFNTLAELATLIEQAIDGNVIQADKFSVAFDETTGKFEFRNIGDYMTATGTTEGLTLSSFMVDKAYSGSVFENNITPAGSLTIQAVDPDDDPGFIASRDFGYSEQFYRYAEGTDLLTDLYTSSGESLGLDDTAILQFEGSVGGEALSGTGTVPAYNTTVNELRAMLAGYLGFENSTESQIKQHVSDVADNSGKIKITGEKGLPNEIDFLKFEVVGAGSYENFYDYFEYQTTQNATGGIMTTTQNIYDAQGNAHTLKYTYTMEDNVGNVWKLALDTAEDDTSVSFNETGGNEVLLHFNNDGSFNYITSPAGTRVSDLTFNFDPGNGAGMISNVEMFLGTPSMFDGVYISAKESSKNSSEQDGYGVGSLEEILFNPAGEIVGYYTNGEVMTIAQVALATFTNNQGLLKVGDTLFAETGNSGSAAIGKPQSGSRGEIMSGALENSNVDLSSEFVNMITTQRGFQANSRVITTSDEMLQELLTLKR
jgi:flagellar hook-basal body protein